MDNSFVGPLGGWEIHGFRTMEDLDVPSIMKEAKSRWLRPNEIHAILSNYTYFEVKVKPMNMPPSGSIILFDRKVLRNFRKDGYQWKKKSDGKTVKEAHEHLKVGSEERVHVYYAHREDNPSFVRRCYWLLDKALEHVVLVHYRETQEGSPLTPVNSNSSSDFLHPSALQILSAQNDAGTYPSYCGGMKQDIDSGDSVSVRNHEMRLHEINTLEWDELLASNDPSELTVCHGDDTFDRDRTGMNDFKNNGRNCSTSNLQVEMPPVEPVGGTGSLQMNYVENMLVHTRGDQMSTKDVHPMGAVAGSRDSLGNIIEGGLQTQDSFGRWMSDIITDSPGSIDDSNFGSSASTNHGSFISSGAAIPAQPLPKQIFCITDMSPKWAYSTEETKILVVGFFHQEYQDLAKSCIFCIYGEMCVPAEVIQVGVFRCFIPPHSPGHVDFYLSTDGRNPISQVCSFEFRASLDNHVDSIRDESEWKMFRVQMRLAHLLFFRSKSLDILSSKVSQSALKEAKRFADKYSNISNNCAYFMKLIENNQISFQQAKDSLIELTMMSRLKEWLLERIADGSKVSEHDSQGQGVLHLCAILGYTWAIHQFSGSGLTLDFRDKFGWTALHWAAYCGREEMVAALLTAGAKPNLVTDPTAANPGGCTAADLASMKGFEGLAVYLSEKALIQQFEDMKIAGNADGTLETASCAYDSVSLNNMNEEEIYLKDTLTAIRTAADAAARIQAAFREHSFKQREKAIKFISPEDEARNIIAAMKIQHAFRNYEMRKKMAAAARIQYRFRSWKLRKDFLNMRRQAIKIQAAFRGYQVRKQYRKIVWSVGVLEKVILRWRKKRKGFRGIQPIELAAQQNQDSDTEEDFFRASRQQAEVRVEKAAVRVQAMFRSRQAQQEYRRMKLAHSQAQLEFGGSTNSYPYFR